MLDSRLISRGIRARDEPDALCALVVAGGVSDEVIPAQYQYQLSALHPLLGHSFGIGAGPAKSQTDNSLSSNHAAPGKGTFSQQTQSVGDDSELSVRVCAASPCRQVCHDKPRLTPLAWPELRRSALYDIGKNQPCWLKPTAHNHKLQR
jgi:hypothetical protein